MLYPRHAAIRVEDESHGIGTLAAIAPAPELLQLPHGRLAAHRGRIKVSLPAHQILDRGHDRAVAQLLEIRHVDLESPARTRRIARGAARYDHAVIVVKMRAAHAERLEDAPARELAQGFATLPAHDQRQQKVVAVAVPVFSTGRKVERPLARDQRESLLVGAQIDLRDAGKIEQVRVARQSAQVMQHVAQGQRRAIIRQLRQVLVHVVVERELAVLGEQQNAHRRELLGDRADVEHGSRRDGDAVFEIRAAVAFCVEERAAAGHAHGAAGRGARVPLAEYSVHARIRRGERTDHEADGAGPNEPTHG